MRDPSVYVQMCMSVFLQSLDSIFVQQTQSDSLDLTRPRRLGTHICSFTLFFICSLFHVGHIITPTPSPHPNTLYDNPFAYDLSQKHLLQTSMWFNPIGHLRQGIQQWRMLRKGGARFEKSEMVEGESVEVSHGRGRRQDS